jgi:hypothetical protein
VRTSHPPPLARLLLKWLARENGALVGDLEEEYRKGRSGLWYWRQALIALALTGWRQLSADKLLVARAVGCGWIVLLAFFYFVGDPLSGSWFSDRVVDAAVTLFGQQRGFAGRYLTSTIAGFLVTGAVTGRVLRTEAAGALIAFGCSVLLALTIIALVVQTYPHPVRVPHVLFYVIWTGLPFVWWSGFVIVPALILTGGAVGAMVNGGDRARHTA